MGRGFYCSSYSTTSNLSPYRLLIQVPVIEINFQPQQTITFELGSNLAFLNY